MSNIEKMAGLVKIFLTGDSWKLGQINDNIKFYLISFGFRHRWLNPLARKEEL